MAAGEPEPFDAFGDQIPKSRKGSGKCARCGAEGGHWDLKEVISNSFTSVRNDNRMSGYGGRSYCAACVLCARTLRMRCISWFASGHGVEFWRTRPETPESPRLDALAKLLDPPEPPFVAGMPLYGVSHGGEGHWQRTPWPGALKPPEPLIKLQSKHVAIYARTAFSRDRYPVQVDDQGEFLLDRELWSELRVHADALVTALVDDGVPPYPSKLALQSLSLPRRVSPAIAAAWPGITEKLRPHAGASWWKLFCELYPTPQEAPNETTRKRADGKGLSEEHQNSKAPTCVPAASNGQSDQHQKHEQGPLQLPLW